MQDSNSSANKAKKAASPEESKEKTTAILNGLNDFVSEQLSFLLPIDRAWQPSDYLPDMASQSWHDEIQQFRILADALSDEVLIVLVGNMVTEEALPNYSVSLNYMAHNDSGTDAGAWSKWLRGWTAEENRHGDLLSAYLRLTGRINMRAVEKTVHHLINNGFNYRADVSPYAGMIYTAFQERATKISHQNVSKIALAQGDTNLSKICQKISGDEARHEAFYSSIMGKIIVEDPENGLLAFQTMMKNVIAMPGRLMDDGEEGTNLFERFATVAQRSGTYTAHDYSDIIEHLVQTWDIGSIKVSGTAAEAQEYLCTLAARYRGVADSMAKKPAASAVPFSWIFGRSA